MSNEEVRSGKDYKSEVSPIWCPGCGDYGVLSAMVNAFAELNIDVDNTVITSGIGCSSRFPFFVKTYGIHTAHGRALPVATGVKQANPNLKVIVAGGDGDGFSIGGGHVPHVARKNVDLAYVMMDNSIYGLTKGQASPTSKTGQITTTTPYGVPEESSVDPVSYCLTYGATFVARAFSGKSKELKDLLVKAFNHKGFAFIDVLSPCPSYNKGLSARSIRDNIESIPEDHDVTDYMKAMDYARNGINGKQAVGVFYQVSKPTYTDRLENIRKQCNSSDDYDINKIVDSYIP